MRIRKAAYRIRRLSGKMKKIVEASDNSREFALAGANGDRSR
jgi:hypothetical protein